MEKGNSIEANDEEVVEVQGKAQLETLDNTSDTIEEKSEINRLLDEGYSVKQIIDLGFKRRTVYYYAKKRVKPENDPTSGSDMTTTGQTSKGKIRHDEARFQGCDSARGCS